MVGDCWLRCVGLVCVQRVVVWLVVLGGVSVVVGLVFWVRVEILI
jgi:hypothetical protein